MRIYKNAYPILLKIALFLILLNIILSILINNQKVDLKILIASICLFLLITLFFRIPARKVIKSRSSLISPADGKIVAVQEVMENEYINTLCLRISIFMSVFNVHQNIIPANGKILYCKHHPGKYLVAFNPKSSSDNERTSIILETEKGDLIRISQIAGLIARRIICNLREGDMVDQGDELGFILFGSRVDIYVPVSARIKVKSGDTVKAKTDVIAEL